MCDEVTMAALGVEVCFSKSFYRAFKKVSERFDRVEMFSVK